MPLSSFNFRLNHRIYGRLRGKALQKASKIVDRFGGLGTSGEYGSIEIDPNDFVIEDDKRDNFDSRISEI